MEYILVIHSVEEGGYWAEIPGLSGCFVQGETVNEVLRDAPDAISSHLDAMHFHGKEAEYGEKVLIATVWVPLSQAEEPSM